ncbi:hypothetical protein EDD22DRAFT_980727 [Suillus occidentalis]|nr:hypothetical protein EDD22DRAFT_980727 [Suillus occidentalis]
MASLKVAVNTGASSAIKLTQLEETRPLCANPDACILVAGDITGEAFVKSLFEETMEKFGRVDLLFDVIGVPLIPPIEEMPLEMFTSVVNVNLTASFLCTREAFKIFKQQEPTGGRIINNGSLAAHVPRPHSVAYAASKHAVHGLTITIAIKVRKHNISVTQIDIGMHVADAVAHTASLPTSVTVLELNIMATGAPH